MLWPTCVNKKRQVRRTASGRFHLAEKAGPALIGIEFYKILGRRIAEYQLSCLILVCKVAVTWNLFYSSFDFVLFLFA